MKIICRNCGYQGQGETPLKGSGWITFILLLFYIVPGIIYMFWRRTGKQERCPNCKSINVLPSSSEFAQTIIEPTQLSKTHRKCPECCELVLNDAKKCKHCGSSIQPVEFIVC